MKASESPSAAKAVAAPLDAAGRRTIFAYSGLVVVALNFTSPAAGVMVIPLAFLLKNRLHLSADALALFVAWTGIPGYFAFAFGVVRDRWSPFGLGDRGYLLVFGAASALIFAAFAFAPLTQSGMVIMAILFAVAFLFMWGAWNGLGAEIGQAHGLSGQLSALWNFAGTSAIIAALVLGGFLSGWLEGLSEAAAVRILFLFGAAVMGAIALVGLWRPAAVFEGLSPDVGERRSLRADLGRLLSHGPIWPALIIWMLWNFSPGSLTVLQYHLTDTLHASDAQWGEYNALYFAASVPAFGLFGLLSRRVSLRALLWIGALLGTPQMIPLLFIHSPEDALLVAVPIGFSGGIATAAYLDLLIRSCPPRLEGTAMMLAWSLFAVSVNLGNLLGAWLYEREGGFSACVAVTTLVYALILPLLLLVPRRLTAPADA